MEKRIKALCSGYYGFGNFGDDAVLKVLIDIFSKKYDLTVLSSSPENTKVIYGVKSIYSFSYLEVIKAIINADIFISGGGSLLQDVTSFKSLLYYLLLIYFAILFKKKIIIFAQGLGPLNSPVSSFLVKIALKHCSLVTVRDEESSQLLQKWNIRHEIVVDPVYNLPIANVEKNGKLGIQLRSFSTLTPSFLENLASAVNIHFKDFDVVLYSLQDSLDLDICEKFSKLLLHNNVEVKNALPIDEMISELSSLDYLIPMRFHAALIGLRAGVNVLPIVYDKKVRILSAEASIPYLELADDEVSSKVREFKMSKKTPIAESFKLKKLDETLFDI